MDTDFLQIRNRIRDAVLTKNHDEWSVVNDAYYRPIHKKVFVVMLASILYDFMSEDFSQEAEHLWCLIITRHPIVGISFDIMKNVMSQMYNEKSVILLNQNKWLVHSRNNHLFSCVDQDKRSYFMKHLISNHSYFDTPCIWNYIVNSVQYHQINSMEIIKLGLDSGLPGVIENIVDVISGIEHDDEFYNVIELILQYGIHPSRRLIRYIIQDKNIDVLKLFYKYDIDVKGIINKTDPVCDQMEDILSKLSISLSDYTSVMMCSSE